VSLRSKINAQFPHRGEAGLQSLARCALVWRDMAAESGRELGEVRTILQRRKNFARK
jgi:hypothetical protein